MKRKPVKKIIAVFIFLILVALIFAFNYVHQIAAIGAGYKAKILASALFISGRDEESILKEDLSNPILEYFDAKIDTAEKAVTSSLLFGLVKSRAVFREGLGVTLNSDPGDEKLSFPVPVKLDEAAMWPMGEAVELNELPPAVDMEKLETAIDNAFAEPDSTRLRRTRAVVVVHDGRIVAEKYARGFSKDTPLLGWSMTKSVINALVGILVGQGKLSVDQPAALDAWQGKDDPRQAITLDHLLRMNSGLEFHEEYTSPKTDVTLMLFKEKDAAGYAMNKPLEIEPGKKWYYSSGTTNIISYLMKQALAESDTDYLNFPRQALFEKIGMTSAVIEPDAAGTFVGSSFMYATARDWARFGLLYLKDGVWNGERILPEGWVKYTTKPTKNSSNWKYGAHFWLNPETSNGRWMPNLPSDLFFCWGHESQHVFIVPSRNLIVVRLGLSIEPTSWDFKTFLAEVLDAFPE